MNLLLDEMANNSTGEGNTLWRLAAQAICQLVWAIAPRKRVIENGSDRNGFFCGKLVIFYDFQSITFFIVELSKTIAIFVINSRVFL